MNQSDGTASLDPLFKARRVAILGASSDPSKIGGIPVVLLRDHFSGEIIPVNPNRVEIAGLPCVPDIGSIGGRVDLAIIALPRDLVEDGVAACLNAGVEAIVLFTAGFGEIDGEGLVLQERIASLCRSKGVRLLGPNSIGLINFHERLYATFSSALENVWPEVGSLAIASQSGAVGTYLMALAAEQDVGLSHFVATGNEADVDVADCIAWFAADRHTSVILAYLEGCRDGRRLRFALMAARKAGKPVIVIKPGATESGKAAISSHTGALAGSKRVFDAVAQSCGAWVAATIEEAVDVAEACLCGRLPAAAKATIVTPSGGVGILLADACADAGIDLPALPADTAREITALLPLASVINPVDTTAQVANDYKLFGKVIDVLANGAHTPLMFVFMAHMGKTAAVTDVLEPILEEVARAHRDKCIFLITRSSADFRSRMRNLGYMVFEEPFRAVATASALLHLGRPMEGSDPPSLTSARIPASEALDTTEAYGLLSKFGIRSVDTRLASSEDEAVDMARSIGYQVVLKIESPDIQHKSDVGGVKLALSDADAVRNAWQEIVDNAGAKAPNARLEGCSVSAMAPPGVDTIIGINRDAVFGPMIMVGLGGIMTEILDDVALAPAPVSETQAMQMITRLKAAKVLNGWRGQPKADIRVLAQAVSALSRLGASNADQFRSIEINPFRVFDNGGVAVDILIDRKQHPQTANRCRSSAIRCGEWIAMKCPVWKVTLAIGFTSSRSAWRVLNGSSSPARTTVAQQSSASGTYRLPRIVDVPAAIALITSGRRIRTGSTATGMIDKVATNGLEEGAAEYLTRMEGKRRLRDLPVREPDIIPYWKRPAPACSPGRIAGDPAMRNIRSAGAVGAGEMGTAYPLCSPVQDCR